MNEYRFTVTVTTGTNEQAAQVMGERLGCDEDYGFAYTVQWSASDRYDHPEGTKAVCRFCRHAILLDQREGGGASKDWGSRPRDWIGNGGIGMDYGCPDNPINDDEGTGGHEPRPSTIREP